MARRIGSRAYGRLRRVVALAERRGTPVYLVGGVVRDVLLGRALGDLDLVVEGDALSLARAVARESGGIVQAHAAFGTASLRFPDQVRLDLTAARRERYLRPAALPQVEPSSLGEDLRRRDFTVNSMAMVLAPFRFGELIDPTGGREDLGRSRLRVLHERSFLDDPTRAFRAVRFAVRLGFVIEPATARLMREAVAVRVFSRLSAARLRREVRLLFAQPEWEATARALGRHGLWPALVPELRPTRAEIERLAALEAWAIRLAGGERGTPVSGWVVALAWLTRRLDGAARARLVERLAPDRRAASDLGGAADGAERILDKLRSLGALAPSAVHGVLASSSTTAWLLALAGTRKGRLRAALERYIDHDSRVREDIDGRDLLRCGVAPGPRVARGLAAALAAKLDGRAPDRSRQLAVALAAARGA